MCHPGLGCLRRPEVLCLRGRDPPSMPGSHLTPACGARHAGPRTLGTLQADSSLTQARGSAIRPPWGRGLPAHRVGGPGRPLSAGWTGRTSTLDGVPLVKNLQAGTGPPSRSVRGLSSEGGNGWERQGPLRKKSQECKLLLCRLAPAAGSRWLPVCPDKPGTCRIHTHARPGRSQ